MAQEPLATSDHALDVSVPSHRGRSDLSWATLESVTVEEAHHCANVGGPVMAEQSPSDGTAT